MTGLYSMLIGFIVGAVIGKFIAPTVLEYMGYTSKDGDVMKYTSLYLKSREGWTQKGSFFTLRWISPTGKCMTYRYLRKWILDLDHGLSFSELNKMLEEFEK